MRQFRSTLESSGAPLRDSQVQPIVDALMAEQRNLSRPAPTPFNARRGGNSPDASDLATQIEENAQRMAQSNQRLHDAVAPHLSSQQMQAFDQMLNRQLEMQQIQARLMRAQAEAAGRDGSSATNSQTLLVAPSFVATEAGVAVSVGSGR